MVDSTAAYSGKSEYLKRYLSKESSSKKKRKNKMTSEADLVVKKSAVRSKIVDDDLDLKAFPPLNDDNYIETGDDAPQIVAVIDDRPLDMRDQAHLWRAVGDKDISSTTEKDRETEIDAGDDNVSNSLTNHQSASESCSQRVRHDSSDSDNAPTRRRSPTRRLRHDSSDSNKSLERHKEVREISSYSPPRRKARHESDSDQSPPRPMSSKYDSDQSPPRSKSTKYDSDQSPPRPKSNNYDSDQSPPRRKSHGKPLQNHARQVSDRKKTSSSDSDLSPQRNKRESSKNQIKHRDNRHSRQERDGGNPKYFSSKKEVHHLSRSGSDSPPPYPKKDRQDDRLHHKTLDGKKAGLQDSKTLKLENEAAKRRERKLFEKMSDEISGKNAETIMRDRATGKRRNLEEERKKKLEEEVIKAEREAQYNKWGKGLKQIDLQKSRIEQDLYEISKPLARYEDDADLDKTLRDQEREGDPMLAFIKKKKVLQNPTKEFPKYKGPEPPPNRFGIRPGYRWDGVDRSNGFEKARVTRQTSKIADEIEAYKWSVEDM